MIALRLKNIKRLSKSVNAGKVPVVLAYNIVFVCIFVTTLMCLITSAPAHLVQQQQEFLDSLEEYVTRDGSTRIIATDLNEMTVSDISFLIYGEVVVPGEDNYDFLISADLGVYIQNEKFRHMIVAEGSTCTMRLDCTCLLYTSDAADE